MERFVAIDNVCAWPNLTRLRDGMLVATIFNQPCHGAWSGDVECWGSRTGRFWEKLGTPAPHEPGATRMNVAAGAAADGSLVVLASGWSHKVEPPDPLTVITPELRATFGNPLSQVVEPWVCRSSDGGRTWTQTSAVQPEPSMAVLIPFGDILLDADGCPCASFYGWDVQSTRREGKRLSWFYRSRDDGRSWQPVSVIGPSNHNETTLLHLGGGKWLAAVRTAKEQHLELFASADNGQSWQLRGPLTLPGQIPGHLLRLADGRILLHHGIRNQGTHGVGIRYSNDEGQTWGPPRLLLDYDPKADGGYPSCLQLDDGMLVTAYYSGGVAAHQRYHMGVFRWMPDPV